MKLVSIFFIFITLASFSQPFPQGYFRSPLNIPLVLSGNFAEIRPNHFHGGLDFKTQGVQGKQVVAAADGYVSRISISPTGYGKAIYINHPNGYTTVYGHLKNLNNEIDTYLREEQYAKQSFRINVYPSRDLLLVKKGDVIALSGNSGSSGGPHLHFEIRETKTERPHNPLLFGLPVRDTTKPVVYRLYAYPLDSTASVNGKHERQAFDVVRKGKQYTLAKQIKLVGKVGFGVHTHDFLNGSRNRCGVYSIVLSVDDTVTYSMKMNAHGFDETRYINAHVDYSLLRKRTKIHKTFIMPNNKLSIYDREYGDGAFRFEGKHDVEFVIFDAAGNKSTLSFTSNKTEKLSIAEAKGGAKENVIFSYDQTNYIIEDDLRAIFPRNTFYDNLSFQLDSFASRRGLFSKVYKLHHGLEPIQKPFHVSIRADKVPKNLRDKALIVRVGSRGRLYAYASTWMQDFLTAKSKRLGSFAVAVDTQAPKIEALETANKTKIRAKSTIEFRISDQLSGIKRIWPTFNAQWVLYDWDAKRRLLTIEVPEKTRNVSDIQFKLILEDYSGNSTVFEKLYRLL